MIKRTKLIKTTDDILDLDIIDFNRLNGYWRSSRDALRTIASWMTLDGRGGFFASWCEPQDWEDTPTRDDFPKWKHAGNHVAVGRNYWEWFKYTNGDAGELTFSDSPDFYGTLCNGEHRFWGDIGRVSPVAFVFSLHNMREGDLWITLLQDGAEHVVLEARYPVQRALQRTLRAATSGIPAIPEPVGQLALL